MNLQENIHRIKEVMGINENYTTWVKRRMDVVRNAERETTNYMVHRFKKDPQHFRKRPFIDTFFSIMMDELHNELSKGGSEDFDYSQVEEELRDSFRDYVEELWYHLNKSTTQINESFISDLVDKVKHFLTPDLDLDNKRQQKNAINTFQKLADLIFKYTIKQYPVKGLEGVAVMEVQKQNWWGNYNDPKDKGKTIEFTVNMQPIYNESVDYQPTDLPEDYLKFEIAFQENAHSMGLTLTSPVQDKDITDYKVNYKLRTFPRYNR